MRRKALAAVAAAALPALPACSVWFFSGEHGSWVDRSRPVALLETTGGVEYGATTEFGVLCLGRTATEGPCRVHYFLGPTPLIEAGELRAAGGVFTEAAIDLKTQQARAMDRSPTGDDELRVMWTPDGQGVETVAVVLANGEGVAGDLLEDPGVELPAGATVLCRGPVGEAMFAGLIAGRATVEDGPAKGTYYVFAGVDRVRELLAIPQRYPVDQVPKYRTDDIIVLEPVDPDAKPAGEEQGETTEPTEPGTDPTGTKPPGGGGNL